MSAAATILVMEENERIAKEEWEFIRSFDPNYDTGLGMLEYPKEKHWKLVRRLIKKISN